MAEIQSVLNLYKKEGDTPLQTIERYKLQNPLYKDIPMTYAGRLDPMAEGLLLVLAGEECKNKEKYTSLDKEYEVEVLFGVSTDTGDILGIVKEVQCEGGLASPEIIEVAIKKEIGKSQNYPAYSSKTFEGKSLWQWAREGIFKKVSSPGKVLDANLISVREISSEDLLKQVLERIEKVKGDFRQEEIKKTWEDTLRQKNCSFFAATTVVTASSGAYMRVFAENVGKNTHLPALALSIKRTKIGNFDIKDSVVL